MSSHFGFPTLVDDELGIFLYPRSWNTNENLKQCEEANERDLRQDVTERIKTGILTILKSLSETETTLTQKKAVFDKEAILHQENFPRKSAILSAQSKGFSLSLERVEKVASEIRSFGKIIQEFSDKPYEEIDEKALQSTAKSLRQTVKSHYQWINPFNEEHMEKRDLYLHLIGSWAMQETPPESKNVSKEDRERLNYLYMFEPWEQDYQQRRYLFSHLLNSAESLISCQKGAKSTAL